MRPKGCKKVYETRRLSEQLGENGLARVPHLPQATAGILGLSSALSGFQKLSVMFASQFLLSCASLLLLHWVLRI